MLSTLTAMESTGSLGSEWTGLQRELSTNTRQKTGSDLSFNSTLMNSFLFRYIFWNAAGLGWSIGKKEYLEDGRHWHKSKKIIWIEYQIEIHDYQVDQMRVNRGRRSGGTMLVWDARRIKVKQILAICVCPVNCHNISIWWTICQVQHGQIWCKNVSCTSINMLHQHISERWWSVVEL